MYVYMHIVSACSLVSRDMCTCTIMSNMENLEES